MPSSPMAFDLLASLDVYEALRGQMNVVDASGSVVPMGRNWTDKSATTYLLLPADGRFWGEALVASLDPFLARHAPAEMLELSSLSYGLIRRSS